MQRHTKLATLSEQVKSLELKFKNLSYGKSIKLQELVKTPEIKQTLEELRLAKKKQEKL